MGQRWVEIDLAWFDARNIVGSARRLAGRMAPLLRGVEAAGVMVVAGWLPDLFLMWSGEETQQLPIASERLGATWGKATYGKLRELTEAIKREAEAAGIGRVRVGLAFVAWGRFLFPPENRLYDYEGAFWKRHPEMFDEVKGGAYDQPQLRLDVALRGDREKYATQPAGIAEGTDAVTFLAAQWAALARWLDVDAILLRDGFPVPRGTLAQGPEARTALAVRLVRALKEAHPTGLVMGYSGGSHPLWTWEESGLDLELLVADGALDVWISQSWGGAWQDWWNNPSSGWTFQLGAVLVTRAMAEAGNRRREGGRCEHWHLVETWDGSEPWDTLHQFPGKLAWAIHALQRAACLTPRGLRGSDGAYVSWAADRMDELLSEQDVAFLAREMNASLEPVEAVGGPLLVYDRASCLRLLREGQLARHDISDVAGFLAKWGVTIGGVVLAEDVQAIHPEAVIAMAPMDRPELLGLAHAGKTVLCCGGIEHLGERFGVQIGVRATDARVPPGFHRMRSGTTDVALPPAQVVRLGAIRKASTEGNAEVQIDSDAGPLLVARGSVAWWQMPERHAQTGMLPPNLLGSLAPFCAVAAWVNRRCADQGVACVEPVGLRDTCAAMAWRSGGRWKVLLGNLESGYTGDARWPRQVKVHVAGHSMTLTVGPEQAVICTIGPGSMA